MTSAPSSVSFTILTRPERRKWTWSAGSPEKKRNWPRSHCSIRPQAEIAAVIGSGSSWNRRMACRSAANAARDTRCILQRSARLDRTDRVDSTGNPWRSVLRVRAVARSATSGSLLNLRKVGGAYRGAIAGRRTLICEGNSTPPPVETVGGVPAYAQRVPSDWNQAVLHIAFLAIRAASIGIETSLPPSPVKVAPAFSVPTYAAQAGTARQSVVSCARRERRFLADALPPEGVRKTCRRSSTDICTLRAVCRFAGYRPPSLRG